MLFSYQFFLLFPPSFFFASSPPWFITSIIYIHSTSQLIYCLDQCSSSMKKRQSKLSVQQGPSCGNLEGQEGVTENAVTPQTNSTNSTTFCIPYQYSKSARTGQCQGRWTDPARHSWKTRGLKLRALGAEQTWARIFFAPKQAAEKPAPSGSTRSTSAKHLVCSRSPNEQRDKLRNQWRLGEP